MPLSYLLVLVMCCAISISAAEGEAPSGTCILLRNQLCAVWVNDCNRIACVEVVGEKAYIDAKKTGAFAANLIIQSSAYNKTLDNYESEQGLLAKKSSFASYKNDGKSIDIHSKPDQKNGILLRTIQRVVVGNGRCYLLTLTVIADDRDGVTDYFLAIMNSFRYTKN